MYPRYALKIREHGSFWIFVFSFVRTSEVTIIDKCFHFVETTRIRVFSIQFHFFSFSFRFPILNSVSFRSSVGVCAICILQFLLRKEKFPEKSFKKFVYLLSGLHSLKSQIKNAKGKEAKQIELKFEYNSMLFFHFAFFSCSFFPFSFFANKIEIIFDCDCGTTSAKHKYTRKRQIASSLKIYFEFSLKSLQGKN